MVSTMLSPDGPECSRIVCGVMKWGRWGYDLSSAEMRRLIVSAIDLGITTFDHADIYGDYSTEAAFGKAWKDTSSLREKVQFITKCGIRLVSSERPEHRIKSYDTGKKHILDSTDRALRNLATDYIDVLLLHRPDPLMDPDEVAEAFFQLKDQGKVLHFGVSNFSPAQFDLLQSRFPLVTNQIEASILHLDPFLDGTFDQCLKNRIRPMAWSPLAGGLLFSNRGDLRVQRVRKTASTLAQRRGGAGLDQILLAWLMQHPAQMLPVIGTANPERLKAALQSLEICLTREEWFELWEASSGEEVP